MRLSGSGCGARERRRGPLGGATAGAPVTGPLFRKTDALGGRKRAPPTPPTDAHPPPHPPQPALARVAARAAVQAAPVQRVRRALAQQGHAGGVHARGARGGCVEMERGRCGGVGSGVSHGPPEWAAAERKVEYESFSSNQCSNQGDKCKPPQQAAMRCSSWSLARPSHRIGLEYSSDTNVAGSGS